MKNNIVISAYDFLAVADKKELFVEAGQRLQIQEEKPISIYPCGQQKSMAFILDFQAQQNSNFYYVIDNNDDRIFYLTNGAYCQNFIIATQNINGNDCKFELGEKEMTISYLQFKKVLHLQNAFEKYQTGIMGDNVYILLTSTYKQDLILFNTISGKVEILSGDRIQITSANILLSKTLDNIARHIVEEEYIITNQGLVKKSQAINYANGRPIIVTASQVVPYAFLQALQVGDISLASSYLDISMRRKIDDEHLKEYFGEIQSFYAVDLQTYFVKTRDSKDIYKFTIIDNKICEIDNIQ